MKPRSSVESKATEGMSVSEGHNTRPALVAGCAQVLSSILKTHFYPLSEVIKSYKIIQKL